MFHWNAAITMAGFQINGARTWISTNLTVQRKACWANVRAAELHLQDQQIEESTYVRRDRTLRLYDTNTRRLLGSTPRNEKHWRWTPAGALLLGIAQPQVEAQPGQPAFAATCTGNTAGDSTASTATPAAAMEVSA